MGRKKKTNKEQKKEEKEENYRYTSIEELLERVGDDKKELLSIFFDLIAEKLINKSTELLAKFIEKKNKIVTLKDDHVIEVWIYKEGRYIPNGLCEIKEQLREILGTAYTEILCGSIINKIRVDTLMTYQDFISKATDKENAHLLPVKNGLLNLRTKELLPFTSEIIFLNKIPTSFNPSATCPNIDKHMKDVLGTDDAVNLMYEAIGYSLWRDHFIEKAFILDGSGRNGKGKTGSLIVNLLGEENCCSVNLQELKTDGFAIAELFGKMVNLAGDLPKTALKDTGAFKGVLGRDVLGANRKFKSKIFFVNFSKQFFACNDLPKVYDNSEGFWSKWVPFKFKTVFKHKQEYESIINNPKIPQDEKENIKLMEPNHILKISTKEEMEGLLNRALDGLQTILKNKEFSFSEESNAVKMDWMRKADSFYAFCQDNIEYGEFETSMIAKNILRKHFHNYCKEKNLTGVSDASIKVTLEEYYGVGEYRNHDQQTFWMGIKFKDKTDGNKEEEEKKKKQQQEKEKLENANKMEEPIKTQKFS